MLRLTVYPPTGREAFEVLPHVAKDLIVNKGWRTTLEDAPVFEKAVEQVETPEPKKKRSERFHDRAKTDRASAQSSD